MFIISFLVCVNVNVGKRFGLFGDEGDDERLSSSLQREYILVRISNSKVELPFERAVTAVCIIARLAFACSSVSPFKE